MVNANVYERRYNASLSAPDSSVQLSEVDDNKILKMKRIPSNVVYSNRNLERIYK